MHESSAGGDEQHEQSQNPPKEAEGWFRFGDEPGGADTGPAARDEASVADGPSAFADDEDPSGETVSDAGEPPSRPAIDAPEPAGAGVVGPKASPVSEPAAEAPEEDERIQPFVVSATPGGVDLDMKEAADAAVVTGVGGGGRSFGLVGALTVMLALFGAGMFAMSSPRLAGASGENAGNLWTSDINEATARATAEGKPLIVHFTADWCPPCREMRKNVFDSSRVQQRLASDFVTARVDLTERGGANDRLAAQFGVRSIPDVQIYHPGGWQLGRFGYIGSADEFLSRLDAVGRVRD